MIKTMPTTRQPPTIPTSHEVVDLPSLKHIRKLDSGIAVAVLATIIAFVAGISSASLPIQFISFATIIALGLTLNDRQLLYSAAILICTLGFVRRLMAGDLGRIESDPMALLPLVFAIVVITRTFLQTRPTDKRTLTETICYVMAVLTSVTYLVNLNVSLSAIYASGLAVATWILIGLIASGRIPDVWPLIYKSFPYLGVAIGSYGIIQFFFLPYWDRAWMIASKLNSIGAPLPEQVRVFGTTESPGPFAIVLGLCLIITLERAISEKAGTRLVMAAIALLLLIPLALTAVRTGLLGIVLAGIFMSVRCLSGLKRLIPLIASVLIYFVLTIAVELFSRKSSVITEGRFSEFDPSNDNSLQARLKLLADIPQYFSNPLGQGVSVDDSGQSGSLDNAFIDILARNGPLVALLLVALTCVVLRACWNIAPVRGHETAVAACCIYLAFFMIAGNIFASGSGLIAAITFGTVLRYTRSEPLMLKPLSRTTQDSPETNLAKPTRR
ncbi:hypothetical protein [Rhodococcoides fascians]|uniref:hypothetical protein n=1 Tax=Rhodococcoides fascians TaxID=1828 RepID=UPI000A8D99A5|nr:hypothetical protein [Rhodococcus fascians]